MDTGQTQLTDVTEAARRLGISKRTLQRLLQRRALASLTLPGGRKRLIDLRDLEALVQQSKQPSERKESDMAQHQK